MREGKEEERRKNNAVLIFHDGETVIYVERRKREDVGKGDDGWR